MRDKIINIIKNHGISQFRIIDFKEEYIKFDTNNIKKIPENAKSILCFAFPYYSEKLDLKNKDQKRNISIYAAAPDYHKIINKIFFDLIEDFRVITDEKTEFAAFVDNSPFNELQLGVVSGLGVLGKNQLILNETYGSYIFLGEIVTNLKLRPTEDEGKKTCLDCKKCLQACPTNALSESGLDSSLCLSQITQKKSKLSEKEENYIKESKILWGCDICQIVCPYNDDPIETNILKFKEDIMVTLDYDILKKDFKKRAFGFRGKNVLRRNLDLLKGE